MKTCQRCKGPLKNLESVVCVKCWDLQPWLSPHEPLVCPLVSPVESKQPTPIDQVLSERGKNYGKFEDQAQIAQLLESVLRGNFGAIQAFIDSTNSTLLILHLQSQWAQLKPFQKESLKMITHKIARIMNGNPDYDDSWRDISGYATLAVDILNGNGK